MDLQSFDNIFEDDGQYSISNPLLDCQLQQERLLAEKAASYPKMEEPRTNFLCLEFRASREGYA